MQYYTLYLEWSTFYKLCFLVDHSFPSVVFPFVNPTKYALFSFIIQFIVYTCDIPHKSLCNYHFFIIKFYVNVYFVKYFIPLLLMEINYNWIEFELNLTPFVRASFARRKSMTHCGYRSPPSNTELSLASGQIKKRSQLSHSRLHGIKFIYLIINPASLSKHV